MTSEVGEEDVELGIAVEEAELRVLQAAEKRLSRVEGAAGSGETAVEVRVCGQVTWAFDEEQLGIAVAEAEVRVLRAAEKQLSSEVAAAGATNRRVLQQWERIKGFNDERSNKWAEYELIRRINQAYAHMWWNLSNGQTQKALAGHAAKAGSALIGSVRAARDLAAHEVTAGMALPPSWLCRPFVDAMSAAADVAAGSAAELEPAVASMARQLPGLQQQAEQQRLEATHWAAAAGGAAAYGGAVRLAAAAGTAAGAVKAAGRTHSERLRTGLPLVEAASPWDHPVGDSGREEHGGMGSGIRGGSDARGKQGRSIEWAVALEAAQMHRI
ncbi:unnamed protein product, partial [Closterium sp. Yama58-4]